MAPPPHLGHQTAVFQITLKIPRKPLMDIVLKKEKKRKTKTQNAFRIDKMLNTKLTWEVGGHQGCIKH